MHHDLTTAVLITAAFAAAADYITGRDYFSKAHIPGRSIWYVAPVLAFALYFLQPSLAAVALGWACWRSVLGWGTFGGRMDPRSLRDGALLLLRHAVSMVFVVPVLIFLCHVPIALTLTTMGLFCIAAVLTAYVVTLGAIHNQDVVPDVEFVRGGLFGVFLAIALMSA